MARLRSIALALVTVAPFTAAGTAGIAQTVAATSFETPAISVGYELARDRFEYEFDNRSRFDTTMLVPHTYRQTYEGLAQWITGAARYSIVGQRLQSEVAAAPARTVSGRDIDTFFNPDGDVVQSGTSGMVRRQSVRVAQWVPAVRGTTEFRAGYRFRRDRSDFLPAEVVVTHSNPPSRTARFTTDRERTISEVHELVLELSRALSVGQRWGLAVAGGVTPLQSARLSTRLPDKYPGSTIADAAIGGALDVRLAVSPRAGTLRPLLGVAWRKCWSYVQRFACDAASGSVAVSWRP